MGNAFFLGGLCALGGGAFSIRDGRYAMNVAFRVATVLAALATGACASLGSSEELATVSGRAIYPSSSMLLPNSVLQVQLLDVSRQNARAELLSETTIPLEGRQPPVEFTLAYRREAIKPSHTYSVRATIVVGNRNLFTTTRTYPVVTRGAPGDVSIRLHAVRAGATGANW
jgi:putative lipoprotein